MADDIRTLQEEIELLKKNLKEQRIKIEEYHIPATMKPAVLKLDSGKVPSVAGAAATATTTATTNTAASPTTK